MTLATAAAVAVASEVYVVPLNDSNNIPNQSESAVSHLFS